MELEELVARIQRWKAREAGEPVDEELSYQAAPAASGSIPPPSHDADSVPPPVPDSDDDPPEMPAEEIGEEDVVESVPEELVESADEELKEITSEIELEEMEEA